MTGQRPYLKGLICTHHFFQWSGSELVVLELIEALRRLGDVVDLFCPFTDADFISQVIDPGVQVLKSAADISPLDYDFIYSQHQTVSPLLKQMLAVDMPADTIWPVLIYNHLSPYHPFELPSPFVEPTLADIILCNSIETKARLSDLGIDMARMDVFPNPAPAAFEAQAATGAGPTFGILRRLLSVSNTLPAELSAAFEILREQGVEVTRLGRPDEQRRVMPADIAGHDGVITIGKTVQYALRSRRPVFCYDRYGGPGWLGAENFTAAAARNFSGRCTPGPRTPDLLATEIRTHYAQARQFAVGLPTETQRDYHLEARVDALCARIVAIRGQTRINHLTSEKRQEMLFKAEHEAALYGLVDEYYAGTRNLRAGNRQLQSQIDHMKNMSSAMQP